MINAVLDLFYSPFKPETKRPGPFQATANKCMPRINNSINEILELRQRDPYILWDMPFHQEYCTVLDVLESTEQYDLAFHTATLAEMQGWKDFNNASFEERIKKYHKINPLLAADFLANIKTFDPYLIHISMGISFERQGNFSAAQESYLEAASFNKSGDLSYLRYLECMANTRFKNETIERFGPGKLVRKDDE